MRRGENRSTRRKTSRSKDENQLQTQPTYDAESGNRTQATLVRGECSHHCAIPAPLSQQNSEMAHSTASCGSSAVLTCNTVRPGEFIVLWVSDPFSIVVFIRLSMRSFRLKAFVAFYLANFITAKPNAVSRSMSWVWWNIYACKLISMIS